MRAGLEREDATGLSFWDVFEGIENSSNTVRHLSQVTTFDL